MNHTTKPVSSMTWHHVTWHIMTMFHYQTDEKPFYTWKVRLSWYLSSYIFLCIHKFIQMYLKIWIYTSQRWFSICFLLNVDPYASETNLSTLTTEALGNSQWVKASKTICAGPQLEDMNEIPNRASWQFYAYLIVSNGCLAWCFGA